MYTIIPDFDLIGLHADTKPLVEAGQCPYPNGTKIYEMDTGDTYMFDQSGNTWRKQ